MSEVNAAAASPRKMLHIQVTGSPTSEYLQQIAQMFSHAAQDPNGGAITTAEDVKLFAAELPADQQLVPVHVIGFASPEIIAQMTYEVNRAYCKGIGDNSFPNDWVNADEHQKAVNRAGVENHLRNPNLTPQQSHQAWMRSKLADGWTYGTVKDAEKKTHPAMVPYEGLPPEQKVKDLLFKAVVDVLRVKLPQPSLVMRPVEVYIAATQSWAPGNFMDLQTNYLWRFKEQPETMFLAQSDPYLQFTETSTHYTIDSQPVKFDVEPAVADDAEADKQLAMQQPEQPHDEVIEGIDDEAAVVDPTEPDGYVQGDET